METKSDQAPVNWTNLSVLTLTPLMTLILVPYYAITVGFTSLEWSLFVLFMFMTGLSISAGYHRLWSHKTYKAHFLVRAFYAFWGACNVQNSVFHWASDHRNHHQFVDDEVRDPYCAKKGVFFSHIGWIIRNHQSGGDDFSNIKDLQKDPILQFQHKFYLPLVLLSNIGIPMLLGYWLVGNPWGMLLLCGLLRMVLNHHFTFMINSLAHVWGRQPFSNKDTSRDSNLVALFTYGEGYHNYHHRFQNDYRNGIKWWNYDPAKWVIRVCQFLGLAKDLKKISRVQIETAIAEKQFNEAKVRTKNSQKTDDVHAHLEEMYQKFLAALNEWVSSKKEWKLARKDRRSKKELDTLKSRYRALKLNFKAERRNWQGTLAMAA